MKHVLLILGTFLSLSTIAQTEDSLALSGESLDVFIPKGWNLLDSAAGDLNQDGIMDLVFAIQDTDSANIELNDGLGSDTVDLNPRLLVIYFGTRQGDYERKFVSKEFIILRDSPTMDEPFDGMYISKKGVLNIQFRFWYSAGSWYMSNHTYRFRFQNEEFALIGYDSMEAHRASGETTDYSINFLTKKLKISKGNFSNDEPSSVEWKSFKLEKLFTMKSLGMPFNTSFEGVYL